MEILTLTIILGLFLGLLILYFFKNKTKPWTDKAGVKLLSPSSFGSIYERFTFKRSLRSIYEQCYREAKGNGGLIAANFTISEPVIVSDLELARKILVKDFDTFVNRNAIDFHDEYFNQMLFNLENQEWKDLRAIMTPTFTTGKIRRMFQIFQSTSEEFVQEIKNQISHSNQHEFDLRNWCGRFTTDVIASTAFGLKISSISDPNQKFSQFTKKMQDTKFGLSIMLKFVLFLTFPRLCKLLGITMIDWESARFFTGTLEQAMKYRVGSGEKRDDFLQLMLEAQAEVGKVKLSDKSIISQMFLFFFAGFDTVETLLTYATYEMALNPEIQEKLAQEIKDQGELTYECINQQMPYLDMFVSETLRKYPPAFVLNRKTNADYSIPAEDHSSPKVIPKGIEVHFPVYSIHHDSEYYPDPEKFDPARFSAESKAQRHPFAYMPFGHGNRNCIAYAWERSLAQSHPKNCIVVYRSES